MYKLYIDREVTKDIKNRSHINHAQRKFYSDACNFENFIKFTDDALDDFKNKNPQSNVKSFEIILDILQNYLCKNAGSYDSETIKTFISSIRKNEAPPHYNDDLYRLCIYSDENYTKFENTLITFERYIQKCNNARILLGRQKEQFLSAGKILGITANITRSVLKEFVDLTIDDINRREKEFNKRYNEELRKRSY